MFSYGSSGLYALFKSCGLEEKEIICHDMRKYVWQKHDFLQKMKKKKRP